MLYAGPLLAARAGTGGGTAGGAETQIFLLARELRRRGHAVAIATFAVDGLMPREVEGVEIVPIPARPPSASPVRTALWACRFLCALVRLDAGVVVQRGAGAVTGLVALTTRAAGRRFVYSSANVIDFDYHDLERSRIALRLFGVGRRLATRIVVQSDEQAELCTRRWGRQSTVIRSLVEPSPLRAGPPEAFLWIARLASYKRPEVVVELARRLPHARFRMVVSPSDRDPELVRRLTDDAGRLENLELLPPRSRSELAPLYDSAVAVLNTSAYEGMSNVLLEGWSRGVPALVYSHDPDRLVESHGLGWVAKGSLDRLTELAAFAWERRHDQSDLSERCRAYVATNHAPDCAAERWESVLELGRALR